jgi:hypothetical protein
MSGTSTKKPFRIFIDDVKIRHTSHWDEDFMSRAELDAAYATPPAEAAPVASEPPDGDETPA